MDNDANNQKIDDTGTGNQPVAIDEISNQDMARLMTDKPKRSVVWWIVSLVFMVFLAGVLFMLWLIWSVPTDVPSSSAVPGTISAEESALRKKTTLTPEEQTRLAEIEEQKRQAATEQQRLLREAIEKRKQSGTATGTIQTQNPPTVANPNPVNPKQDTPTIEDIMNAKPKPLTPEEKKRIEDIMNAKPT
jgi:hypothetical protein